METKQELHGSPIWWQHLWIPMVPYHFQPNPKDPCCASAVAHLRGWVATYTRAICGPNIFRGACAIMSRLCWSTRETKVRLSANGCGAKWSSPKFARKHCHHQEPKQNNHGNFSKRMAQESEVYLAIGKGCYGCCGWWQGWYIYIYNMIQLIDITSGQTKSAIYRWFSH